MVSACCKLDQSGLDNQYAPVKPQECPVIQVDGNYPIVLLDNYLDQQCIGTEVVQQVGCIFHHELATCVICIQMLSFALAFLGSTCQRLYEFSPTPSWYGSRTACCEPYGMEGA